MPRKVTGEAPRWRQSMKTWVGRVRGYPEGCARGRWLSLGTDDKHVASQRYERWLATGEPPKEARTETFKEAAERIVDAMPTKTRPEVKKAHDRRTRLRTYVFPIIGHIEAWAVNAGHCSSVLDRMPALGLLKGTIAYVRTDMSQVMAKLVRGNVREDNPARSLAMPSNAVEDGRLRQVPSDAELLRFREKRGFETQLDIACLLCRDMAGHRTSDLLEARWEHVTDWETGRMKVRRPKTDTEGKLVTTRRVKSYEMVEHGVPPSAWIHFKAWWQKQGSPKSGPVFPVERTTKGGTVTRKDGSTYQRKATKVGAAKARNGTSFTKALRRAFWGAGIVRPLPGWDPANPDKRYCAFQTDTDESRALDFHSLRRAFVTALKGAGVPTADVLALAGHTQLATSSRYDTARLVQAPDAALPRPAKPVADAATSFDASAASKPGQGVSGFVAPPLDAAALLDQMRQLLNAAQRGPGSPFSGV